MHENERQRENWNTACRQTIELLQRVHHQGADLATSIAALIRDTLNSADARQAALQPTTDDTLRETVSQVRRLTYYDPGDDIARLRQRLSTIQSVAGRVRVEPPL